MTHACMHGSAMVVCIHIQGGSTEAGECACVCTNRMCSTNKVLIQLVINDNLWDRALCSQLDAKIICNVKLLTQIGLESMEN